MLENLAQDIILTETLEDALIRLQQCFGVPLRQTTLKHFLLSKGITIISFDINKKLHINEEGHINLRVLQDEDFDNEILLILEARIDGQVHRLNV